MANALVFTSAFFAKYICFFHGNALTVESPLKLLLSLGSTHTFSCFLQTMSFTAVAVFNAAKVEVPKGAVANKVAEEVPSVTSGAIYAYVVYSNQQSVSKVAATNWGWGGMLLFFFSTTLIFYIKALAPCSAACAKPAMASKTSIGWFQASMAAVWYAHLTCTCVIQATLLTRTATIGVTQCRLGCCEEVSPWKACLQLK